MLIVKAQTIAKAWEKCLIKLYYEGNRIDDPEILRDDTLLLEIEYPLSDRYHYLFPMDKDILKEYITYILKGGEKGKVLDEHALYHERLFSFPPNNNNQVEAIIQTLQKNPFSKRAQACVWYPNLDQIKEKVPCLQILWCRIEHGKLVTHTHMRANDAYQKLLMNLTIFTQVVEYIAERLKLPVGKYIHIVDSFHIYKKDEAEVREALEKIQNKNLKNN